MGTIFNFLNRNLKTVIFHTLERRAICSVSSSLFLKHIDQEENNIEKETNIEEALLETDKEYEALANRHFGRSTFHNCFIIHPYVKWGPKKVTDTTPELKLQEAVALIRTLAPWKVHDTIIVPLTGLHKKTLFGSGTLEKLKRQIRGDSSITAVFINVGTLKNMQIEELEAQFGLPILDRYKIVMQILRLHAISTHARLQVALAELPYLRSRLRKADLSIVTSGDYDNRKLMLQNREQKLKAAVKKLQFQRQSFRYRRTEMEYPVIAIVGYTNSGKTSLIKALTGEKNLQPKNELFATLDVTVHAGQLPSTLEVLYVDTVGFISDIPTTLIECFVVTLEDAMHADVIVHVEDLSSQDLIHQRNHVLLTLQNLMMKTGCRQPLEKMITVGNKYDLVRNTALEENMIAVSATTHLGIDLLRYKIEETVLNVTERKTITIKVPSGGDEMRWLFKNSAVVCVTEDKQSSEHQNMKVILTKTKLEQFKSYFIRTK